MSAPTHKDPHTQDDVCPLERDASTAPYAENPTYLFLEPLGTELWRSRLAAGQLALPPGRQ